MSSRTRKNTEEEALESAAEADPARPQQIVADTYPPGPAATRPRLSAASAASMQRAIGNAAIARLVAETSATGLRPTLVDLEVELGPDVGSEASPDGGPLPERAEDAPAPEDAAAATEGGGAVAASDARGKVGESAFSGGGGGGGGGGGHAHADAPTPTLDDGSKSEFGEIDGEVSSGVPACLFIDGGRVGEGAVHWSGGNGGQGLQGVGDIQLTAPAYDGLDADATGPGRAWITPGTGTLTVTRSFRGVLLGANGTYFFTARARARTDVHERLHVAATKAEHDRHIVPLEQRVAQHTGEASARVATVPGATKAQAIAALQTFIDWDASIQSFRQADIDQNRPRPMGKVDAADLRAADFIKDYGARRVLGVTYDHYIDQPPGPAPPPPSRRGGPVGPQ